MISRRDKSIATLVVMVVEVGTVACIHTNEGDRIVSDANIEQTKIDYSWTTGKKLHLY